MSGGNIIEAIQEISVLLPVLAPLAALSLRVSQPGARSPMAPRSQPQPCRDRPSHCRIDKRACSRTRWKDVNGVATTIKRLTPPSSPKATTWWSDLPFRNHIAGIPIKNFAPVGELELPEYELQKLSFPPILQIID